jgi:hypothetical protein
MSFVSVSELKILLKYSLRILTWVMVKLLKWLLTMRTSKAGLSLSMGCIFLLSTTCRTVGLKCLAM